MGEVCNLQGELQPGSLTVIHQPTVNSLSMKRSGSVHQLITPSLRSRLYYHSPTSSLLLPASRPQHWLSGPPSPQMSWMDSWSRPTKSQAIPAPYYLLTGGDATLYCHTCGRVISKRRSTSSQNSPIKYCSSRCQGRKPGKIDRQLDSVFRDLLEGGNGLLDKEDEGASRPVPEESNPKKNKKQKGESRILIRCSQVEKIVFGVDESIKDVGQEHEHSSDLSSDEEPEKVPITQDEERQKMEEGQKKANRKEMVKRAARRAVVFGLPSDTVPPTPTATRNGKHSEQKAEGTGPELRKCEAVVNGKVVEPSFAKGDWGIRWRE